jgi:hypothetical protein
LIGVFEREREMDLTRAMRQRLNSPPPLQRDIETDLTRPAANLADQIRFPGPGRACNDPASKFHLGWKQNTAAILKFHDCAVLSLTNANMERKP